ncbi:Hypothetical_protein [Hexamita inflata]|uniref:Hypothetical_protein n=2 Tax=Hexamita inflata TaxID=28002 RepID=A0AA86P7W0_9EUKA|nr:Hypothetical protein HINF_LOCUS21357 [Hexamita inflata]
MLKIGVFKTLFTLVEKVMKFMKMKERLINKGKKIGKQEGIKQGYIKGVSEQQKYVIRVMYNQFLTNSMIQSEFICGKVTRYQIIAALKDENTGNDGLKADFTKKLILQLKQRENAQ